MNFCQVTLHAEKVSTVPIVPAKSDHWEDSGKGMLPFSTAETLERIPAFKLRGPMK